MHKKFKLTDKVTKESIRSPEFKRWLMRTLAVVFIISLIFQFSTCVYQGLNAYAVDEPIDGINIGEWYFNKVINVDITSDISFSVDFVLPENDYYSDKSCYGISFFTYNGNVQQMQYNFLNANGSNSYSSVYNFALASSGYNGWSNEANRRLIITGGEDANSIELNRILTANAVKVTPPIVYDFTNEIRVFNDELTFFVTDQASWVDVFYFDYEILGLGVCDYMTLQRTTSNEYLMRYNVVSDGADGYLHTSYRYYVAQSRGGFLRENYKTIRFITNPDNTDLQQWLLDNTTLIGTVDDQETFDYIYGMGFDVGYNSGYEQGFANSLIGDSLSGPINALSSITLIQIGDTVITLGGVIMTAIALCLVLAFLKLYAGG